MKIALTGHRPKRLKGQEEHIKEWIVNNLSEYNDLIAYSGMAQGADQIFANAVLESGGKLICCYPYKRKNYHPDEISIMEKATDVRYISESYTGNHVYWLRDKYMVDNCDILLAVWDGEESGGTWITIKYARDINKPIKFYNFGEEIQNAN